MAHRIQRANKQTYFSLWPQTPIPTVTSETDTNSTELGLKFSSSITSTVIGMRFYKGVSNTGTHTGALWTATGTLLATVTFTNETASGWQTATFPTPITINANTTYVVSYHALNGFYSADINYFATSSVTTAILNAPVSNGVYIYSPTTAFPTQIFQSTNYWVDVIVTVIVDTTPPSVPTNLSGTVTGSLVQLTWTASTDNIGVASYRVYRNGAQIGTANVANYTDHTAQQNTTYTYAVCAVDYSSNISQRSTDLIITTGANIAPVASFTTSQTGLTVYTDASATSDVDGTISNYAWDWGDASTSSGIYGTHHYAVDGTYTIKLTATDNLGATNSVQHTITVSAAGFMANLINNPSSGGYPDATNTGVPAGTTLTNSGSITVTLDGAIIENLNITGEITVNANNVIIRKCRITDGGYYPILNNGINLMVVDTEIIGTNSNVTSCVAFTNYTVLRCNIYGAVDGLKGDSNVLVQDSFIHNLTIGSGTHNDGTQSTGGTNITIRHNTYRFGDQSGITSCLQIGNEWGMNSNWLVENNLFDGGGWSISGSSNPADNSNMRFLNNRFTRRATYGVGGIGGSTWSGNYYDDTGTVA